MPTQLWRVVFMVDVKALLDEKFAREKNADATAGGLRKARASTQRRRRIARSGKIGGTRRTGTSARITSQGLNRPV
jgi:hypothetical protein